MIGLRLEKAGVERAKEVQAILDRAPRFTLQCEGLEHDPDYALRDLTALPPGCTKDQKHYFIIRHEEVGVGVGDIVRDYPEKGTAFLGLLLLVEERQGAGIGRAAYFLMEDFAKSQLSAKKIRLAFNDSNPVGPFWEKMGFRLTGESKPYQGRARTSVVHLMEKSL